jgi:hypothetical protein
MRSLLALGLLTAATLLAVWPASSRSQPAPEVLALPNMPRTASYSVFGQPMQPRDPELAALCDAEVGAAREVNRLTAEYSKTEGNEARTKIKDKLAAALEKQFTAQQKRRELELARVEAQVKKLRELMKKRDEQRKTIIDNRLDQLVREADGLGWTPPPVRQPGNGGFAPLSVSPKGAKVN